MGDHRIAVDSDDKLRPIRIQTLGQFAIEVNGELVRFGSKPPRKPLELLKAVIALGGSSVSVEGLCESLWPDADGDRARSSFTSTLSRLRKLVGSKALDLQDGRLSLVSDQCWVDAGEFTAQLEVSNQELKAGNAAQSVTHLEQAISLYKGPFLDGEFDPPEILSARERLHGLFLRHIDEVANHYERTEQTPRAIDLYRRGLEVDDCAEELCQSLMRCYRQSGRTAEGIAVYERLREVLQAKYTIEPSLESENLYQSLLAAHQDRPTNAVNRTKSAEVQEEISRAPAFEPGEPDSPPHPPPPPEPQGERRTATVAFFDLHGYTEMNERLDPEEVEGIMSRIKTESVRIVESHGGIVNQFVGDEVLALFGIPVAHEDDPVRAVRAALEIIEEVARIGREFEATVGRPLQIHGAINTGLIVTNLRDGRDGQIGITGDTINTGAGLAALAQPGEILLSQETQRLIEPYFRTEALPPVNLKGKAQPLVPYRILSQSAVTTRFEASEQRGLTPFTGRVQELAALQNALASARSSQGQFVTAVGEPGVGKSRLLYEFKLTEEVRSIAVLRGFCRPDGSNTPYLPFLQALRMSLQVRESDDLATQRETVVSNVLALDPALKAYLPIYLDLLSIPSAEHTHATHLHGEELRRAIQLALAALITQGAARRPTVLLLEDWHWSDEPSRAVLKSVLGSIADSQLMVVVTYRPEFAAHWGNASNHTSLMLNPLPDSLSKEIIEASLGSEQLPAGLAALIHERTDGNPLFIEEVCRGLLEEGEVTVNGGQATLNKPLETLSLPGTVEAVIRSRLDNLDTDARYLLHLAAVIGRQFSNQILERLTERPEQLATSLEALSELELIQQVRVLPDAQYRFKHAVTRDVAYDTLLMKQRKVMHLQVAEAIESLYAERISEYYEALATHYQRAESWTASASYFLKAAEASKEHYAYPSAQNLCEAALEATSHDRSDSAAQADMLTLLGDLHSLNGELEHANERYEEAAAVAGSPALQQAIANRIHHVKSVERDGARIVYYEHGGGEDTLLLANPVVYGLATFQPVVERLCQDFRIITIDMRGSGDSDPVPRGYNINDHIEDVRAVIEDSGCAPATGIGISRGGNLMIKLSLAYPGLLKSIILVSSAVDDGGNSEIIPPLNDQELFIEALVSKDKERIVRIMLPTLISEPGTEDLLELTIEAWCRLPLETLLNFYARDPESNILDLLVNVSVPTLVMHGTEDRRLDPILATLISERIPDSTIYMFEGIGHLPHCTATSEFCAVLKQFLRTGSVPQS